MPEETFKDRIVHEQKELSERKMKLHNFINTNAEFMKLDDLNRYMLEVQLSAMETYDRCLISRIRILNP